MAAYEPTMSYRLIYIFAILAVGRKLFVALGAVKCGVTNFQISFMILVVNCKDISAGSAVRNKLTSAPDAKAEISGRTTGFTAS